jgi:hypothetical protein
MRSSIVLIILLALVAPSIALSPIEQAYMDGVKIGLSLGQLVDNVDQYNAAIQQFNDHLNQTFAGNASQMWLPKKAVPNNTIVDISTIGTLKPVHKMDGTPTEITAMQY